MSYFVATVPRVRGAVSGAMKLFAVLLLVLVGCTGINAPSLDLSKPATMRAVLSLEAHAVVEANALCGGVARAWSDESVRGADESGARAAAKLNRDCTDAARAAQEALMTGQSVLDVYEAGMGGRVACAAASGIEALRHIRDLVGRVSPRPMPASVDQAIDSAALLVSMFGASCPLPEKSADAGPDGGPDAGQ